MKVITAPEIYKGNSFSEIKCFLGGGISGCYFWQQAVIDELSKYKDLDALVIFNPRRDNFPMDDPNAAEEQISWEYKYLTECDIFSMFFCDGESDQPICMYELGRNLLMKEICCDTLVLNNVVITCHNDYNRKQDVEIQVNLSNKNAKCQLPNPPVFFASNYGMLIENHAKRIVIAYHNLMAELESGRIHDSEA